MIPLPSLRNENLLISLKIQVFCSIASFLINIFFFSLSVDFYWDISLHLIRRLLNFLAAVSTSLETAITSSKLTRGEISFAFSPRLCCLAGLVMGRAKFLNGEGAGEVEDSGPGWDRV